MLSLLNREKPHSHKWTHPEATGYISQDSITLPHEPDSLCRPYPLLQWICSRCIIATIIPGVIIFAGGLRLHALLEHKRTSLYFLMMDKLTLVTVLFPKGTELRAALTTLDFRIEKASLHFLFSHDWEQTAGYTANHPVFLGGASSRSG